MLTGFFDSNSIRYILIQFSVSFQLLQKKSFFNSDKTYKKGGSK
jgi:hypothetical protein